MNQANEAHNARRLSVSLVYAIKNLNAAAIKEYLSDGYNINLPLTLTGIPLWSLAMCMNPERIASAEQ